MGSRRTGAEKLRILIVDEGHAGHAAQSRGFVHAARASIPELEASTLKARLRTPGVLRESALKLSSESPHGLPEWLLRCCYDMPSLAADSAPNLIVSSGGQGAILAASLARRYAARWIFCGDASGLSRSCLDIVVSPLPRLDDPLWLRSELLFCEPLPPAGAFKSRAGEMLAAVLIGGPSRSHRYAERDWSGLVEGLHQLAESGWRFLLTTSARTPPEVEDFLRTNLVPNAIHSAVWWHRKPERLARQFLADAEMVLVTQDSLTMTSEAVAARKPVVVLAPEAYRPAVVLEAVLEEQARLGRLLRCRMDQVPEASDLAEHKFHTIGIECLDVLALRALTLAGIASARG